MILYVLVIVFWNKAGINFLPGFFPDEFNCQVAEGRVATMLHEDKAVTGWSFIGEPCSSVMEAKKI